MSHRAGQKGVRDGVTELQLDTCTEPFTIEVVIEVPRGSFLKRSSSGALDFVSPIPCPFNYGSVHTHLGLDGDLLDALVLGPRLGRGTQVQVTVFGAIGLTDRSLYDDKLVCSHQPISQRQRRGVVRFFHFYAQCKRLLNFCRGQSGLHRCNGWGDAGIAISRARIRDKAWTGPTVPF
jgi:inorganic pyrophosphatase